MWAALARSPMIEQKPNQLSMAATSGKRESGVPKVVRFIGVGSPRNQQLCNRRAAFNCRQHEQSPGKLIRKIGDHPCVQFMAQRDNVSLLD